MRSLAGLLKLTLEYFPKSSSAQTQRNNRASSIELCPEPRNFGNFRGDDQLMELKNKVLFAAFCALVGCGGPAMDGSAQDARPTPTDAAADNTPAAPDSAPPAINCQGLTECGGACVDLATNNSNCGRCGRSCGANVCVAGECQIRQTTPPTPVTCTAPMANCDGNASNGCEANLTSDNGNCGTCGARCNAGYTCTAGRCTATPPVPPACTTGWGDCDGNAGNGCEANLSNDVRNCGACGTTCGSTQTCTSGRCVSALPTCPAGTICGGVCVSTSTDTNNCGACGNRCNAGWACSAGRCIDPCTGTRCSGYCVDTNSDVTNCGACGVRCGSGQACTGGVCRSSCAGMVCAGVCCDLTSDPNNCGACGRVCPTGNMCVMGACRAPASPCSGGQTYCPGGICADLQNDANNCGGCNVRCPGGSTCSGGVCRGMSCTSPGQMWCSGTCRDTNTDMNNCGACGTTCLSGYACSGGRCREVMSADNSFYARLLSGEIYNGCTSGWIVQSSSMYMDLAGMLGELYISDVTGPAYSGQHLMLRGYCPSNPAETRWRTWGSDGTSNANFFSTIRYRGREVKNASRICLNSLHPAYPSGWREYVPAVPFNGAADNSCPAR